VKLLLKTYCLLFPCAILLLAGFPASAFASTKTKAAELAGAVLYRDKDCAHCHGAELTGTKKAPALPTTLRKDKRWTPQAMTAQILDGGKKMPPFRDSLTDGEVAQLVAYLRAKHRLLPPAKQP
jgi:mono/diheme cytochrome c family protein